MTRHELLHQVSTKEFIGALSPRRRRSTPPVGYIHKDYIFPTSVEEVLLDGEPLKRCVACDDRSGYADVYPEDEPGQPFLDENDEFITVRRHGMIEVFPGPDGVIRAEYVWRGMHV